MRHIKVEMYKLDELKKLNANMEELVAGGGTSSASPETYLGISQLRDSEGYFQNYQTVIDTKEGMNETTGIYTVKESGAFVLYCTKSHDVDSNNRDIVNLYINGNKITEIVETFNHYADVCGSYTCHLDAGDEIGFYMNSLLARGVATIEIRRVG